MIKASMVCVYNLRHHRRIQQLRSRRPMAT